MPKSKSRRTASGNDSDSDDGGFLTRFHHLPVANAPEPHRLGRESNFSSSYVLTSSRTVITVSMIFALLESVLCSFGIAALYEEFEPNGRIISVAILVTFVGGEGFRIYVLSRWWGTSPRSDIEPNRAYGETIKCITNSSLLIILLICPISLVVFFAVYALASLRTFEIPGSLLIFVLVAGFDLMLFLPCFACPTAVCAACFWKRIVRRHERGMQYLAVAAVNQC